jgi:hypothetical protein
MKNELGKKRKRWTKGESKERRNTRDDLVFVIISLMLVYYFTPLRFTCTAVSELSLTSVTHQKQ